LDLVSAQVNEIEQILHDYQSESSEEKIHHTRDFCNLVPSAISSSKRLSKKEQIRLSTEAKSLCEEELRDNLARRGVFRTVFSNDSAKDSPFDLIDDLDQIDLIFYGEKFEDQEPSDPSFPTWKDTKTYTTKTEFWQDQSADAITNELGGVLNQKDYASYPSSIVGNLAGMDPALSILGGQGLVPGISTSPIFEFPQHEATGGTATGASPQETKNASPDKSDPESKTILSVTLLFF